MTKKDIILSIITVSYNTKELTLQTLETAIKDINSSKLLKGKVEIFVVDNDSHDGSPEACENYLKKIKFPHFKVFANKENLGFAKANNQATKVALGKYIFLLNSDTITQAGALERLVKTFEKNPTDETTANLNLSNDPLDKLGLLSPTLLNPDGSIQNQGGSRPSLLAVAAQFLFLDDIPFFGKFLPSTQHTGMSDRAFQSYDENTPRLIKKDWIGGTAMMIKRELIDDIGMLDGNIFMYGEDQEYCLRAKNHHWDVAIHPKAKIVHFGCASSSSKNAIHGEIKGYLYIWKKHFPHWQLGVLKSILYLGCSIRQIIYKLSGQKRPSEIYGEAKTLLK